ncbi:MAG: hypothetical protein JWM89_1744 [Acidimicrobiales bacterium]|nr:hypothetical protein [Acidimicrobiales bacterium]
MEEVRGSIPLSSTQMVVPGGGRVAKWVAKSTYLATLCRQWKRVCVAHRLANH